MKYQDLKRVMAMMGTDLPEPNHSGWSHISCLFAPWKHRSGNDRSHGMAIVSDPDGVSAYMCPACKSHGRIENLARELGRLRGQSYDNVIQEVRRVEHLRMASLPPWEQRNVQQIIEPLPEPLDPEVFDPTQIFDPIGAHDEAVQFMRQRRVSYEAVQKAGIRFDPDKRRIVFPVWNRDGNLYGFTGRTVIPNHEPKVLDYANLPKRMLILGEQTWRNDRATVLIEGLFAYARFLTEGVDEDFNVGAILGSVITPGKAAILKHWSRPTHLILDPDEAGDAGIFGNLKPTGRVFSDGTEEKVREVETGALWQLAEHMPTFVPNYPDGVFDPDDLTREQVRHMVETTPPSAKPKAAKTRKKMG